MHLGSAPRIPCPLRRFVLGAVSCCRCRLCYLGLSMSTGDPLHLKSGIHTPSLRYQLLSSPLCAFLGSLLLRHYVRMSTISLSSVVFLHGRRSFEAARNDAALASVPFLPKHTYADCPLRRICRTALVPPPCLVCMYSCGQAAQFCIREEYDTCVE